MFDKRNNRYSIGIVGVGISTLGVLEHLRALGVPYSLTVRSTAAPKALPAGVVAERLFIGDNFLEGIDEDILFLSPTVRPDRRKISLAAKRGVKISSDAELFFGSVKKPVFSITGTDGKSTTATVASELLLHSGVRATLCGNIGRAMSPTLDFPDTDAYVAELSSFQLMSLTPKSEAAVITNISENHLDWHKSMDEYIGAKENVLKRAERRIICADSPLSVPFIKKYGADAVYSTKMSDGELLRLGAPMRLSRRDGYILKNGEPYLSEAGILLRQEHFLSDYLAAIALLDERMTKDAFLKVSESFAGLEHRAKRIGCYGGVEFIDSSIDSTPKRTLATLRSLPRRVVLILGGRGKKLSYDELLASLHRYAKAVVLTGEAGLEMLARLESGDFDTKEVGYTYEKDFDAAVAAAVGFADAGDTVLLSPAATSHDAFSGYKERGARFAELAKMVINKEKI